MTSSHRPKTILHVITGLHAGGAEGMLTRIATTLPARRWRSQVVSLIAPGVMEEELSEAGVPVVSLGMRRGVPDPRALGRLRRIIRTVRPDLLQTWMYHADLLGGLAGTLERRPVVWNVRHSNLDSSANSWSTRLSARACATLSRRLPDAVIYCSTAAAETHTAIGYQPPRAQVLPNGFDLRRFVPDRAAREETRATLGAAESQIVIGSVARFHPQKGHATLIAAAGHFAAKEDALFVLVGPGCDPANRELGRLIAASGVEANRFRLLGFRDDVGRLLNGFDIATSSSLGEGFPNAVGEAMACATPCVVTDVGDSALLVGETGVVVPSRDPAALAAGWQRMVEAGPAGRAEFGRRARKRMEERFSIEAVAERYAALYESLLRRRVKPTANSPAASS